MVGTQVPSDYLGDGTGRVRSPPRTQEPPTYLYESPVDVPVRTPDLPRGDRSRESTYPTRRRIPRGDVCHERTYPTSRRILRTDVCRELTYPTRGRIPRGVVPVDPPRSRYTDGGRGTPSLGHSSRVVLVYCLPPTSPRSETVLRSHVSRRYRPDYLSRSQNNGRMPSVSPSLVRPVPLLPGSKRVPDPGPRTGRTGGWGLTEGQRSVL